MITFVTGNKHKLQEVQEILGSDALDNRKLDLEEVQGSIEEITTHKAASAARIVGGPVLVDDTALEFNALGGMPGPYIKWFLESMGTANLAKMLHGFEDKGARAICTFGYCAGPDEPVHIFQGIHPGQIVEPRGEGNFGWNPIFLPHDSELTYAQMSTEEKNAKSHRAMALAKLREFLRL